MPQEIRGVDLENRKILTFDLSEEVEKEKTLRALNFVKLPRGRVKLGTPFPLPCRFEGHRVNETPVREMEVDSFWINKFVVTNKEFEEFNPRRLRPPTSEGDRQPATNVTYFNALRYTAWFSEKYGLNFSLPTEPEWVYAAAPFGWEYFYHPEKVPDSQLAHNFVFPRSLYRTLNVDDNRFEPNVWGLYHIGGNVQEYTLGSYYTGSGAWGASTDGRYCIVRGGDFGHCPLSSGVNRRGIGDVSARSERVGFRLVHPNLLYE